MPVALSKASADFFRIEDNDKTFNRGKAGERDLMNVCAQTPTQQMARVGPPEPQINASSSTVKKQRGRPRTRQILEDRGDPSVPVPYNLMAKALPDGSGIQVTWAVPDIAEYPNLKPIGFNIIGQTNKKAIWSIKVALAFDEGKRPSTFYYKGIVIKYSYGKREREKKVTYEHFYHLGAGECIREYIYIYIHIDQAEVKDPNAREAIIDRSLRKDCRYQYRITALYYTSTAIGQAESRRSHASQEVHWAFEDILASSRGPKSPRPAKMSKYVDGDSLSLLEQSASRSSNLNVAMTDFDAGSTISWIQKRLPNCQLRP